MKQVANQALKTEVRCSSETWVDFQQTAWQYTPENKTIHKHHCENVKSYILQVKWDTTILVVK
jgi:hypothetical protein